MRRPTIADRVARLESRLTELQAAIKAQRPLKDWRRTIGAFTDDAGMQAIMQEAMRLREADRKKGRAAAEKRRKPD
jgi:hypothetical protein